MEKKFSVKPGLFPQAKLAQVQVPLAKIIPIQKLIQLGQTDFINHIEKTVSENPFLEKEDFSAPTNSLAGDSYTISSREQATGMVGSHGTRSEGEVSNSLEEINTNASQSLTGNLLEQIKWLSLSPRDEKIAFALISLLDADGYLSEVAIASVNEVVEELREPLNSDEKVHISLGEAGEVDRVLDYLQKNLDPPGILARSLTEALSLMLQRNGYRRQDLPVQIIQEDFDALSKKDYAGLKKRFGVSSREVKQAVEVINSLDPYPLRNQTDTLDVNIIVPDVIIRERGGVLEVEINREYIPQIRILKDLMEKTIKQGKQMASSQAQGIGAKEQLTDKNQANDFIFEKRNEALNLMNAITFRESNLKKIMDYLAQEQYEFFIKGFIKLKPMRIIDTARELGVDKASISRLVNRKYVATYWGTFSLREMFSLPVEVGREHPVSAKEIQAKIKQLQTEFKDQKLSDQKIADMLAELGYKLARRTVNKYRRLIKTE